MRAGRIMSDGKTTAATRFWRVGFSPKRAHASVIRARGRKRKTAKSMSHAVVFPGMAARIRADNSEARAQHALPP